MSRDWRLYLDDIEEAARRILEYTRGMSFDEFLKDTRTYDAVIRNFMVIGEAAKQVPPDIRQQHAQVPWSKISRFRDRLVHGYRDLDDDVLWSTARDSVAPLLHEVQRLLADEDQPPVAES